MKSLDISISRDTRLKMSGCRTVHFCCDRRLGGFVEGANNAFEPLAGSSRAMAKMEGEDGVTIDGEAVVQGVKPQHSNIWTVSIAGSSPTAGSE